MTYSSSTDSNTWTRRVPGVGTTWSSSALTGHCAPHLQGTLEGFGVTQDGGGWVWAPRLQDLLFGVLDLLLLLRLTLTHVHNHAGGGVCPCVQLVLLP